MEGRPSFAPLAGFPHRQLLVKRQDIRKKSRKMRLIEPTVIVFLLLMFGTVRINDSVSTQQEGSKTSFG